MPSQSLHRPVGGAAQGKCKRGAAAAAAAAAEASDSEPSPGEAIRAASAAIKALRMDEKPGNSLHGSCTLHERLRGMWVKAQSPAS